MPDYPGLGLALRYNPQGDANIYPIGAHGSCYGSESEPIPVRELAMMSIMDRLTDKEYWNEKVFDEKIVSKWREEALAIPNDELWKLAISGKRQWWDEDGNLTVRDDTDIKPTEGIMTAATFDCCILELRDKAEYYEKSGIVPTLDACASVAKSDKLVSPELHKSLRKAFETLKKDQASAPDWHPRSNEMVQDLIHPSMYPLVYGRSRVLKDELVGVSDAIERWAGKGEIVPKDKGWWTEAGDRFPYNVGSGEVPPQYWSQNYQWLPANVAFQEDGSVKFTSYINNLHPTKYPDIYRTIEKLIETSLPAWDQCLAIVRKYDDKDGAGRLTSRFGSSYNRDDEEPEAWIPSDPEEVANVEVNWDDYDGHVYEPEYDNETEAKWKVLRKPRIPEPIFENVNYAPQPGKRLIDMFQESGLQVIVKMASIELTPEKPEFPVGGWHVEGQMNEHICATALYYLDSENITETSLSFRMQTSAYLNDEESWQVGQDCYHWMEQFYGTGFGYGCACLQNYGSVETRQGRLLAFPNVFQHRVSPFRLVDPSKPGHRRFIALWLVDPNIRIISTANVPPQQQSWWVDAVLGSTSEAQKESLSKLPAALVELIKKSGTDANISGGAEQGWLPPELVEIAREHLNADADALPMSFEEAKEHRLKLMDERSAFVKTSEKGYQQHSYGFCEH